MRAVWWVHENLGVHADSSDSAHVPYCGHCTPTLARLTDTIPAPMELTFSGRRHGG